MAIAVKSFLKHSTTIYLHEQMRLAYALGWILEIVSITNGFNIVKFVFLFPFVLSFEFVYDSLHYSNTIANILDPICFSNC